MNGKSPATDDLLNPGGEPLRFLWDSPSAIRLKNVLSTMNAAGPDAEERHAEAVREMNEDPEGVMAAVSEALGACGRHQYTLRWSVVYAATRLRHPAAIPVLRNLVLTTIPPEESKQPHSFSTVGEETVLRTTAVEGLGALAAKGSTEALDSLFAFLSVPSISVRRASVQAILAADPNLGEKVAESLPREFRYLLDVTPKQVQDVPQVKDPTRYLRRDKERDYEKPSPPRFSVDPSGDPERGGKAPRTGD